MSNLVVQKGRTNLVIVDLGVDISSDTFESDIREGRDRVSDLIATWIIDFDTDGTDGRLVFTMDDAITSDISVKSGFMDIKRISSGEPLPVFDKPIKVEFRETVTP